MGNVVVLLVVVVGVVVLVPGCEPSLFLCAPSSVRDGDYEKWSDTEKILFGICWDSEDTLKEMQKKAVQMKVGSPCDSDEASWHDIQPGINDVDYFDDFHEDVLLPPTFVRLRNDTPPVVRVLNKLGFEKAHQMITTDKPVCDQLSPSHEPIECDDGVCKCRKYVPNLGTAYRVHFSVFKEKPKPPVQLEFDKATGLCTFPASGECLVQPTEGNPDGYLIPCRRKTDKCLIRGNDFACTRINVVQTMHRYNAFAFSEEDRLEPFRLFWPIPCYCTSAKEKSGKLPGSGIEPVRYYND